jgi:hypothetical protein
VRSASALHQALSRIFPIARRILDGGLYGGGIMGTQRRRFTFVVGDRHLPLGLVPLGVYSYGSTQASSGSMSPKVPSRRRYT